MINRIKFKHYYYGWPFPLPQHHIMLFNWLTLLRRLYFIVGQRVSFLSHRERSSPHSILWIQWDKYYKCKHKEIFFQDFDSALVSSVPSFPANVQASSVDGNKNIIFPPFRTCKFLVCIRGYWSDHQVLFDVRKSFKLFYPAANFLEYCNFLELKQYYTCLKNMTEMQQ